MKQEHNITDRQREPNRGLILLTGAALAAPALLGGVGQAHAMTYSTIESVATESEAMEFKATEPVAETEQISVASIDSQKVVLESADQSAGTSYSFTQLNSGDPAVVSDQLKLTATQSGKDTVAFTFYNSVGQKSSITDIYLTGTGGILALPGKITAQSPGVSYSIGASPPNLPVGTVYDFYATVGADSNPPVQPNGINAVGEYVTWTFTMASGITYDSVIKAIDNGVLRFGLFVPGYSGGSSSFINTCGLGGCKTTPSVPLPASLWLMFGALGGLAWITRRTRAVNTSI